MINPAKPNVRLKSISTNGFIVSSSLDIAPMISIAELNNLVRDSVGDKNIQTRIWKRINEIESIGDARVSRLNDVIRNSISEGKFENCSISIKDRKVISIAGSGNGSSGGGGDDRNNFRDFKDLAYDLHLKDSKICLDLAIIDTLLAIVYPINLSGNIYGAMPIQLEYTGNQKLVLCPTGDGNDYEVSSHKKCPWKEKNCSPKIQGEICSELGQSKMVIQLEGECSNATIAVWF